MDCANHNFYINSSHISSSGDIPNFPLSKWKIAATVVLWLTRSQIPGVLTKRQSQNQNSRIQSQTTAMYKNFTPFAQPAWRVVQLLINNCQLDDLLNGPMSKCKLMQCNSFKPMKRFCIHGSRAKLNYRDTAKHSRRGAQQLPDSRTHLYYIPSTFVHAPPKIALLVLDMERTK